MVNIGIHIILRDREIIFIEYKIFSLFQMMLVIMSWIQVIRIST